MREIKFRGKRKDNKEWVYGDLTQSYPKDFPPEIKITWWVRGEKYYSTNPVDKETIGQYTGLKDKNGKEIYEGDIVQCSQKGQTMKGVVTFNKGMWSWQFGNKREDSWLHQVVKKWNGIVIGNIHKNPKLLEVKKWNAEIELR
jgi:uncharacterized phage protein (TIGR01671 family)